MELWGWVLCNLILINNIKQRKAPKMTPEVTNAIFSAIEDEDFLQFSKSIKSELERKIKEHPMTIHHQSEYQKFKSIEGLYAKAKAEMERS